MTRELQELLAAYLDGAANPHVQAALKQYAAAHPEAVDEILEFVRDAAGLHLLLDQSRPALPELVKDTLAFGPSADAFAAGVVKMVDLDQRGTGAGAGARSARSPRTRLPFKYTVVSLAAAAALLLCGYGVYLWQAGTVSLRVAESQGAVTVTRAGKTVPVRPGLALHEGDRVAVPAGGTAALQYDGEATRIELPGATATFATEKGAKRVKLAAGTLVCTAAPQKLPLEIKTPNAVARVVGTQFTLEANAEDTRIQVMAGLVRLTRTQDNASVDVPAGHEATVSSGADLRATPTRPPGLLLDLDFEDRILPQGSEGTIVEGPRAANSRFCVTGVLVKDYRLFRVHIRNGDRPLFTYREGAVLSFDYWVKKQTDAIDVYFWNATRSVSPGYTVYEPVQEQWTRVAIRLTDTKDGKDRIPRDGDIISDLTIQTTPGGNELFVDNIRIETKEEP